MEPQHPPPLHYNGYTESTNNVYSNEPSQPVIDESQTNPCNCNSCLSHNTFTTNNFIATDNPPLIQQFINDANERNSPIYEEQRIIGNEQQIINQPIPDGNTTINSQTNYIELFKIEISGVEIVVRKKSSQDFNYDLQQRNEKSSSNLTNRGVGRTQNRMHPYQIPNEKNCKHNKYSFPHTSVYPQDHISDINQNYINQ